MIDIVILSITQSLSALGTIVLLLIAFLSTAIFKPQHQVKVPFLDAFPTAPGESKPKTKITLLREGYERFKTELFQFNGHWGCSVILPLRFLDEIMSLGDKVSFREWLSLAAQREYTGIARKDLHDDVFVKSVKSNLTHYLGKAIPELQQEIEYAFMTELPECDDWISINVYVKLLRIIALVSGRLFVNQPLNRDEEFLHSTIRFTVDSVIGARRLLKYPKIARPLAQYFIPEIQAIPKHLKIMSRLIGPVIKERLEAEAHDPNFVKPNDMTQWLLDNSPPEKRGDPEFQALAQLNVSFAAIHTTSMALTHCIYDIAARPEYVEPLREEYDIMAADSGSLMTKKDLAKLKKLDSFLKESQRHNPLFIVSVNRIVTSTIRLSDGTILPKGTQLYLPYDPISRDPTYLKNPTEFDGFRFEKMRKEKGSENKYQYVTIAKEISAFGYGPHACPGRFFAAQEIKLLISYLLRNYDIKLVDEAAGRPANIIEDFRITPDITKSVLFRKRPVKVEASSPLAASSVSA